MRSDRVRWRGGVTAAVAGALMISTAALARPVQNGAAPAEGESTQHPTPAAASKDAPQTQDAPPPGRTLDDLLGITPRRGPRPPHAAEGATAGEGAASAPAVADGAAPSRDRLDRALREEELGDSFAQAVELMRQSLERLGVRQDPGIETQRVQEDAVRKLDAIIDAAKRRRQQSSQRSQAQSQSQQNDQSQADSQEEEAQAQASARARRQAEAQRRRQQGAQGGDAVEPPGLEEGEVDEVIHEGRVEWGNLPPRLRDLVQQGRRDRASSLYLRLTEEYYRRMAEEASR